MAVYIISDLHFGHENIAKHRGFKNAEEQDELIIKNWNNAVHKKDVVWVLGDITMEKIHDYHKLLRLNGLIRVVLGNHDLPQHVPELLKYIHSVCGVYKYKKKYIFTHIPVHDSEIKFWSINIHGHTHEKIIDHPKYINVSADVLNYTPILITELIEQHNKKWKL